MQLHSGKQPDWPQTRTVGIPNRDSRPFQAPFRRESESLSRSGIRNPRTCHEKTFKGILLFNFNKLLAGVVGFEPTISCTKNSCPTARPHPNSDALITLVIARVQEQKGKKFSTIGLPINLDGCSDLWGTI